MFLVAKSDQTAKDDDSDALLPVKKDQTFPVIYYKVLSPTKLLVALGSSEDDWGDWIFDSDKVIIKEEVSSPFPSIVGEIDLFFRKYGLHLHHIAALLGTMKQESRINPYAVERPNDPLSGLGLIQWTGPRRALVPTFTGNLSKDVLNQCMLISREWKTSENIAYRKFIASKDLPSACKTIFSYIRWGVRGKRDEYSANFYQQLLHHQAHRSSMSFPNS